MIMIQLRNSTSGQTAWFPKITKETVDSYTKTEVYTKSETNSQIDDKINRRIWTGTQAQYEATAKDSSTIYIITE